MKFCIEYLVDFNGTRAAIAAGYSEKSAKAIAHENLTKPDLRRFIDAQLSRFTEDQFVSRAAIVNELARYAFKGRNGSHPGVKDRDAIQALVLLDRHVGMFWEKPHSEDDEPVWMRAMKQAQIALEEIQRTENEKRKGDQEWRAGAATPLPNKTS